MKLQSETIYIAYGSNLNLPQMARRCPTAQVLGASVIKDYELLFQGSRYNAVATVEPCRGSRVPALLWTLAEKTCRLWTFTKGIPTCTVRRSWMWSCREKPSRPWCIS